MWPYLWQSFQLLRRNLRRDAQSDPMASCSFPTIPLQKSQGVSSFPTISLQGSQGVGISNPTYTKPIAPAQESQKRCTVGPHGQLQLSYNPSAGITGISKYKYTKPIAPVQEQLDPMASCSFPTIPLLVSQGIGIFKCKYTKPIAPAQEFQK